MTVTLATWAEEIYPDFPGMGTARAQKAILEAATEFCKNSLIWYEQLNAIEILIGQDEYALSTTLGRVVSVRSAKIDDTGDPLVVSMGENRRLKLDYVPSENSTLYVGAMTDLTYAAAGTITSAATDFATAGVEAGQEICVTGSTYNNRIFTVDSVAVNIITVDTTVDTVTAEGTADAKGVICIDGLVVWANLQPDDAATTLPDILWDDWRYYINEGARSILFRTPRQEWYDPNLAAFHFQNFKEGKYLAASTAKHGRGRPKASVFGI